MRVHKTDVNNFPRFSYVKKNDFVVDSLCFMTGDNAKYILTILNSHFGKYHFEQRVAVLDDGGFQMRQQFIEEIYIPPITESNHHLSVQIEALLELRIKNHEIQNPNKTDVQIEAEIDQLVYELYGLTEKEIKIVEESV
jgi:hypothetical protein